MTVAIAPPDGKPLTPVSPQLLALRKEAGVWTSVQYVLAQATIKAGEWSMAQEILTRVEQEVTRSQKDVEVRVQLEEELKPKTVIVSPSGKELPQEA